MRTGGTKEAKQLYPISLSEICLQSYLAPKRSSHPSEVCLSSYNTATVLLKGTPKQKIQNCSGHTFTLLSRDSITAMHISPGNGELGGMFVQMWTHKFLVLSSAFETKIL